MWELGLVMRLISLFVFRKHNSCYHRTEFTVPLGTATGAKQVFSSHWRSFRLDLSDRTSSTKGRAIPNGSTSLSFIAAFSASVLPIHL